MAFSGYLNVYNFQRELLAARKADAIAMKLYAYFGKDFLTHTDAKTLFGWNLTEFQSVVLPNDLIINFEGQWEGWKHDCVLCFMNRVS